MTIETVVCSVADALTAQRCGVGRIELCAAIEAGGLTPSAGLAREVHDSCPLPIMAMVRPRSGGFVYTDQELTVMERDIEVFRDLGIHGVVFGLLDPGDQIDPRACAKLVKAASGMETVFHRAFDRIQNPFDAVDNLASIGFTRLMTGGGEGEAAKGAPLIRQLREHARGRIEVMAAGGIRQGNVKQVVQESGVDQIHLGPFRTVGQQSGPYGEGHRVLDADTLQAVVTSL